MAIEINNASVIQAMQSCINLMADIEMLNLILVKLVDNNDTNNTLKNMIGERLTTLKDLDLIWKNSFEDKWTGKEVKLVITCEQLLQRVVG